MQEINDIYDIIDILREKNNLSIRKLALLAEIPPTTLVSVLSRKPKSISKNILINISNVLNVTWYELLNKTESFANQCALNKRIYVTLSEEDIRAIKQKFIQLSNHAGYHNVNTNESNNDSIMFVMKTLNEDGMLEVMKKIVEIASNPKYRKGA